jgi:hypothetical protein
MDGDEKACAAGRQKNMPAFFVTPLARLVSA